MAAAALALLLADSHPVAVARAPTPAPILIVTSPGDPFGSYYGEILQAEGLNEYDVTTDQVTPGLLANRGAVLLAKRSTSADEASALSQWVNAGGDLVAMRPSGTLATLLGLGAPSGTLSNAFMKVDGSQAPGEGITSDVTMQFHDTADLWTLNGARAVATLYTDETTPTASPAVTIRGVGALGGTAAAFTYDLARSVVQTRQGNPAWAGQERDNDSDGVIRSDDLFFGAKPGDVQPDWVDFNRITIPQADEQQRLLANLLTEHSRMPLPRFWYLPRGLKAAVVLTGDDHGDKTTTAPGYTIARFANLDAHSAPGCSVADWECLRMTSYAFTTASATDQQVADYQAKGFEYALHLSTNCHNFTLAPTGTTSLPTFFTNQLAAFHATWPSAAAPVSNRTHCVPWSTWSGEPLQEAAHGIRLDMNYYYWPSYWVNSRPGLFTGSGLPMRFADTDGTIIDVYQAATQITDETIPTTAVATFKDFADTLLDDALGDKGYYAVVTANLHTDDKPPYAPEDTVVNEAKARGVPVISAKQLLDWLDERNAASFSTTYDHGAMTFTISAPNGSHNLQAMLPVQGPRGELLSFQRDGADVTTTPRTVKGVDYLVFDADPGTYTATYVHPPDPEPTPTPTAEATAAPPAPTPFAAVRPPATPAPPTPAPAVRVSVTPASVRASRTGAVKLTLSCASCTSSVRTAVELRLGKAKAASRTLAVSRKATSVTLKLDRAARRKLTRAKTLKATVVVTPSGQSPTQTAMKLLAPKR